MDHYLKYNTYQNADLRRMIDPGGKYNNSFSGEHVMFIGENVVGKIQALLDEINIPYCTCGENFVYGQENIILIDNFDGNAPLQNMRLLLDFAWFNRLIITTQNITALSDNVPIADGRTVTYKVDDTVDLKRLVLHYIERLNTHNETQKMNIYGEVPQRHH